MYYCYMYLLSVNYRLIAYSNILLFHTHLLKWGKNAHKKLKTINTKHDQFRL